MYHVAYGIYHIGTWCTDEDDVPSTLKLSPLLTGLGWPPLLPPLFSGRRGPPPGPLLVIMSNAANGKNNNYYIHALFLLSIVFESSPKSVLHKNIIRTARPRNEKPPTAKTTTTTVTAVRSLTRTRHEWPSRRRRQ